MAATLFFLNVGTATAYLFLLNSWTFTHQEKSLVAGSEYRLAAKEFIDAVGHEPTPEEIVRHFAGEPRKVWTLQSIARRKHVLVLLYVATIALITGVVIAITQASFCLKRST